ncbi:MAG TPA: diguanylate cyclase [Acidimicrobiia bacterium]
MTPTRATKDHRAAVACGALAVVAVAFGVAAAVADEGVLGLVSAVVAVVVGALGVRLDVTCGRAEDSLWEARTQTRALRRQLDQIQAELDERTAAEERAGTVDLPEGTDTEEWEIDPVSGMLRERHLPVLLQQVVAAARRKVLPVTVIFWELDGFDTAPQETRDQAVTALGAIAWRALRESDAVFRIGDVAAVAVLIDTAEPGATIVADRVREALRSSPVGGAITVSAGIACYPTHALDAAELVSRAGRALQVAREGGHRRDHVAVATSE